MNPQLIRIVVFLVIAAVLVGAGWQVDSWRSAAEISRLEAVKKDAEIKAEKTYRTQLETAIARADSIQTRLAQEEAARDTLTQEKDLEIHRLTVGRRCLDSNVVRVLNQPAQRQQRASVPETPREPVRANAPFATDSDVGWWINQCQAGYDTCRGQRQGISDFYNGSDTPTEKADTGE